MLRISKESINQGPIKLHLGCGLKTKEGYLNIDQYVSAPNILQMNVLNLPFEEDSVDEIFTEHMLEHLSKYEVEEALEEWARVLKPQGKLIMNLPNLEWCLQQWLAKPEAERWGWQLDTIFGLQTHPGEFHKTGFTEQRLRVILTNAGFRSISIQDYWSHEQGCFWVEAGKSSIEGESTIDLNSKFFENTSLIQPIQDELDRPFLSVMIPVFNPNAEYLKQALSSVLDQVALTEAIQIEVVDDCSTEVDVEAIVREIGRGKIAFHKQPKNLGLLANWNDCLQRSKGYWIHLLHQDDIVLPGFYAQMQSSLKQTEKMSKEVGAAFCRHFHIDSQGNQYYISPLERPTAGILENWLEHIAVVQRIQFASIVVKRSVYETLGGFCLEAGSAADWEMWKRIANRFSVWYEPEPLACYRIHNLSESSRLTQQGQNIADTRRSLEISASYLPIEISATVTKQALENYAISALQSAQHLLKVGNFEAAFSQIQEGLKCSASPMVQARLASIWLGEPEPSQLLADRPLDEFNDYIKQYKQNPSNPVAKKYLLQVRHQVAHAILNCPADEINSGGSVSFTNWVSRYKALIDIQIYDEFAQDFENSAIETVQLQFENASISTQTLLVASLYHRPEEAGKSFDLSQIPDEIVNTYVKFLLSPPGNYQKLGDAERYYYFMKRWIEYLHEQIFSHPGSTYWQEIAKSFTTFANFRPLYFNYENLKELYLKRAEIMAFSLASQGHELNYEFPERSADRQKIRLGILARHFSPQTETFVTLPYYKNLDRDTFEIILFSCIESHHRLEQYCAGHSDGIAFLPKNLAEQVEIIREADLDIVLIATNVTIFANPITLLALHRLARVQIVNTSSCTTTGMSNIDYFTSGTLTELENAQQQYSETLLTYDGPAHCYDFATEEFSRPSAYLSRADLGLRDDEVVYISGANFFKILPEVEQTWAQILAAVPNSKLVLYPFNPNWAAFYPKTAFNQRLQTTLEQYQLDSDRVIVLDAAPTYGDVKERLKLADIYLDAFPFSGATSLIDPLAVGLPLVVMSGNSFRSHMAAAFLLEMHMPELIASNTEEYIRLSIDLGTNTELRQQKREQIVQKMQSCPGFIDSRAYSAQTNRIFQDVFYQYQATQLQKNYCLRQTNLVALPDWNQPEADLLQSLADLLRSILTDPNSSQISLLIVMNQVDQELANELLRNAMMQLLIEEELEVGDEEPEISLISNLSEAEWPRLLPHLSGRLVLAQEDAEVIAQLQSIAMAGAAELPIYSRFHL